MLNLGEADPNVCHSNIGRINTVLKQLHKPYEKLL